MKTATGHESWSLYMSVLSTYERSKSFYQRHKIEYFLRMVKFCLVKAYSNTSISDKCEKNHYPEAGRVTAGQMQPFN